MHNHYPTNINIIFITGKNTFNKIKYYTKVLNITNTFTKNIHNLFVHNTLQLYILVYTVTLFNPQIRKKITRYQLKLANLICYKKRFMTYLII